MDSFGARSSTNRPDWYPDPTHRFEYRYHNGTIWTGDVSVDGKRFLDPLQPSMPTAPTGRPGGKAVAAFVLGLGSVVLGWVPFLCVLAAAAAVLAIIFAIAYLRSARRLQTAGANGRGFAIAGLLLAPLGLVAAAVGIWLSIVVLRAVDDYTNVGVYTVDGRDCGVVDGRATFAGTITNQSSTTHSYHLVIEFLRKGTDNALYTESTDIDNVAPQESAPWSISRFVSEPDVDCRVRDVSGPLPFSGD